MIAKDKAAPNAPSRPIEVGDRQKSPHDSNNLSCSIKRLRLPLSRRAYLSPQGFTMDRTTMQLMKRPLPGGLGAEIAGCDFDRLPDEVTRQTLRDALLEHHLLLLRGRTLAPAQQVAFTSMFGDTVHTCSPRTRFISGAPEIARVSNREGEGLLNIGAYWHSDGAYLPEPTAVSIHHIIVPTSDGDTLYTDLAAAYDRLSPTEKSLFATLGTRSQSGVAHPLVIRHPATGRVGLYVNFGVGTSIIDRAGVEHPDVRRFILAHLDREGTFYRHAWQAGDLVVADNFAVAHHATLANPASLRILHRTSIHGPSAWWRTAGARRQAG